MALDLIQQNLSNNQYIREKHSKTQIYLHHTAGNPNAVNTIAGWEKTSERIGTAFIIAGKPNKTQTFRDGQTYQCFHSAYWAYHLGLSAKDLKKGGPKAKTNDYLHKISIGIEICSWGGLTKTPNGFKTYVNTIVPDEDVIEYTTPYRGYKYYQRYTDAQLESTRQLLVYLCDTYGIPKKFVGMKMFDICPEALQGVPGIWTHVSVRSDKNDVHPQLELIQMLQSL